MTSSAPTEKFRGRYRSKSARLPEYDYSHDGAYFITTCTKDREHFFGNIRDGEIRESAIGTIARQCWMAIQNHFSFVLLGEWVVMPNHVHGVLVFDTPVGTPNLGVPTTGVPTGVLTGSNPAWKPGTLGVVINQYKRACTIESRKIDPRFAWQPRFHDHIIRNKTEFDRISKYIADNPKNWKTDDLHV